MNPQDAPFYMETTIPPGMTAMEYRRSRPQRVRLLTRLIAQLRGSR